MNTVDNLVLKIVNYLTPTIEECISSRDARVLRSMATSIASQYFITENQSKLIIKILKENAKKMPEFSEEIDQAIVESLWSRPFRQIPEIKKLYISKNNDGDSVICLESSFLSHIRHKISQISKNIEGFNLIATGKIFHADLTEKNIVTLVETFSPLNFEIDELIKHHYKTIKSWSKNEVEDQFLITNITHQTFHKQIALDIGLETHATDPIIFDRSIRYQYTIEKPEIFTENLTNFVAFRNQPKIWIDSTKYKLSSIISTLVELKRLPVLVVFNTENNNTLTKNIENLVESLEENNITDNVGIYFRLPNDDNGKKFNAIISENKYNKFLTNTTKVVGIQSGKIPKFFLNSPWKPMSVIFVGGDSLRHNKSSVYASCCDLIISYCEKDPLIIYKPWL
jgi:ribosomal protein L31E